MLDTVMTPRSGSGAYCKKRQEWLREKLAEHSDESVYLFMHHPPFNIHLPALDRIGLVDKQVFSDIVRPHTNIRHLFFGHAHRPICGNWQGISFSTLRSTNYQVVLNFTEPNQLVFCDEAPEYAVVFLSDKSVVIHSHPYLNETSEIGTAKLV
jgi:3',5'-cyclic AMP phosphodiesterase CpdA